MIKIKRIYDPASPRDGKRIYIDRLWPRGMKKEEVKIDQWLKEVSPSDDLRKWFGHDPSKYSEFNRRYKRELKKHSEILKTIRKEAKRKTVTLLFSAKDEEHNNAMVMREILSK
ncbi:MAG TPA: DUF488 family protein [Thermodesulfobacteriota bacterium]|nr:DUF488 family protein [Thermodesulfobacteriota bacterium]